jgi:hypothetical protein
MSRSRTRQRELRPWRFAIVGGGVALLLASLAGWGASTGTPTAAKVKAVEVEPAAEETTPAKPDTVRILIQTVPPRRAHVRWGGKSLGTIPAPSPLVVERPRDSGPLDLVIRAAGFLPVHTRAYTFTDSRVAVRLTPPSEKSRLFGYREEPPPNPDGGVPDALPAAGGAPAPSTSAPVPPPIPPAP